MSRCILHAVVIPVHFHLYKIYSTDFEFDIMSFLNSVQSNNFLAFGTSSLDTNVKLHPSVHSTNLT